MAIFPLCAFALAGCSDMFGSSDAHLPGTALGGFHVQATASQNTCGEGALGASKAWEFDVHLSRGEGSLYWDNGAQTITGALSADDVTFSFATDIKMDMRSEQDVGLPPCSVARHDESAGVLDSAAEVMGFSGSLAFAFQPAGQCDDLVHGDAPVFAALPCAMSFGMQATRTEAPSE